MPEVPDLRLSLASDAPANEQGELVLYWMTATRRVMWNFALDRAVEWARRLDRPLVILEDLRLADRWDSDRLHRFALDGMADNAARLQGRPVLYYPYVEPSPGSGDGLLPELSRRAAVVITDDFPCGAWPQVLAETAGRISVRVEKIDSNGLLPLAAANRAFPTARGFRGFLQRELPEHLASLPKTDALARVRLPVLWSLPAEITRRWPAASVTLLEGEGEALRRLPIDHAVGPCDIRGGTRAAERALRQFISHRLVHYADGRNHPDDEVTSGLSPYLHFGHISAHQIVAEVLEATQRPTMLRGGAPCPPRTAAALLARQVRRPAALIALADKLPVAPGAVGARWVADPNADAFLDQIITWREVGYNFAARRQDLDRYESLPAWARLTLAEHARDPRPYRYSLADLEAAATHDDLWNAAQRQLVREGRLHNYLRMVWGKKILHWTASPEAALEAMIHLNNKYALDGRNPNSYSGILWVLGRYDRAWGPERPVFGKVRYMSSANTRRKLRLKEFLLKHAM
jgi:deoxyribodipyrimidine photo-lyase